MTFKPWTPEQIAARDAVVKSNIETTLRTLGELANKHGYSPVESLEELQLSPEQISQIQWNKNAIRYKEDDEMGVSTNLRFYTADRSDGQKVKLIAKPVGEGSMIAADFFTPGFHKGHGGNHDFNYGEMEGNMKLALELPQHK